MNATEDEINTRYIVYVRTGWRQAVRDILEMEDEIKNLKEFVKENDLQESLNKWNSCN